MGLLKDVFKKAQSVIVNTTNTIVSSETVDNFDITSVIKPMTPEEHEKTSAKLTTKNIFENIKSTFNKGVGFAGGVWENTTGAVSTGLDWVKDNTVSAYENTIKGVSNTVSSISNFTKNLTNTISNAGKSGLAWIKENAEKAWNTTKNVAGQAWDWFKGDVSFNNLDWINSALVETAGHKTSLDTGLESLGEIIANIIEMVPSLTAGLLSIASAVTGTLSKLDDSGPMKTVKGAWNWVKKGVGGLVSGQGFNEFSGDSFNEGYESEGGLFTFMDSLTTAVGGVLQHGIETYANWMAGMVRSVVGGSYADKYQDGVTETKFGQKQEESWRLFVSTHKDKEINFIENNPVSDWGTEPILFGAPPRYTYISDPRDRSYMNTFIKDGSILSILPGKPKYNGLNLTSETSSSSKWNNLPGELGKQITEGQDIKTTDLSAKEYSEIALDYLKSNGISGLFNKNDKRYYTFEPDLESYYSYLETMLNTIYTRMGLGENISGKNDLFTFFTNPGSENETLLNKFNGKSLGFYFEGSPSVSENMGNTTGDPAGMKSTSDALSDEFQRMNYVTGFGRNKSRNAGVFITKLEGALQYGKSAFESRGNDIFKSVNEMTGEQLNIGVGKRIMNVGAKATNLIKFASLNDLNAMTQSLMTTNGMKTQFPNLWTESNYSKSVSVDFEFVSPYGDPLSIFQHVYTPLAALLSLALPKQAAENGYVNPFFLRMDIPGVISSDFAIISSISWVRGGQHNLWTTDRHPRAISVTVTFEDLFEYLAMTRRVSYLSANPNYSMFLDSFSGIRSLYNEETNINNEYWSLLVNRLNSSHPLNGKIWNTTSVDKTINKHIQNTVVDQKNFFTSYYKRDLTWMKSK